MRRRRGGAREKIGMNGGGERTETLREEWEQACSAIRREYRRRDCLRRRLVRSHERSWMIFSSGTRSPAPHQAAMMTSGFAARMASDVVCEPGSPMNSPPAGFDEFSDPKLRVNDGFAPFFAIDARTRSGGNTGADSDDIALHSIDDTSGAMRFAEDAGNQGNIGINISQDARGEE